METPVITRRRPAIHWRRQVATGGEPVSGGKMPPLLTAAVAVALTFGLVLYPEAALQAAVKGMDIFFRIVFPSLLPFFVLSEIMLGLGVVHFIGVLFQPLMRPLFNVPGEGAFALSMGLAAGYPMDAVITARFRKQGLCTRVEGERLLAFTNTADPLFILGAVAVGMFQMEWLGARLALAHYLAALTVGLLFRFYAGREAPTRPANEHGQSRIFARAVQRLLAARREDGRSLGQLMGDAVTDSVRTLLMICGFIMLFSVLVKMIEVAGLQTLVAAPFAALFRLLGIAADLVPAAMAGFLEIDLGTMAASQSTAPLWQKAMIASAVIAWSGLSVHGQVASVLTGTDVRMGPYVIARLLHAVFAAIFTVPLITAAVASHRMPLPAFAPLPAGSHVLTQLAQGFTRAAAAPLLLGAIGTGAALLAGGWRIWGFYQRKA